MAIPRWLASRNAGSERGLRIGDRLADPGSFIATTGETLVLGQPRARALVLVFMSNRCPGVKAYDGRLRALARDFQDRGVRFIGVNSIPEVLYPRESLVEMRLAAEARGLVFPYVKDPEQDLMLHLGATCTPQAFVLDQDLVLRYRGRIDDAFLEAKASRHDLRDALGDVLSGRDIAVPESPAIGCAIDVGPGRASANAGGARRPTRSLARGHGKSPRRRRAPVESGQRASEPPARPRRNPGTPKDQRWTSAECPLRHTSPMGVTADARGLRVRVGHAGHGGAALADAEGGARADGRAGVSRGRHPRRSAPEAEARGLLSGAAGRPRLTRHATCVVSAFGPPSRQASSLPCRWR